MVARQVEHIWGNSWVLLHNGELLDAEVVPNRASPGFHLCASELRGMSPWELIRRAIILLIFHCIRSYPEHLIREGGHGHQRSWRGSQKWHHARREVLSESALPRVCDEFRHYSSKVLMALVLVSMKIGEQHRKGRRTDCKVAHFIECFGIES